MSEKNEENREEIRIGIFYPHPLYGSLGSMRRVKEIGKRLKNYFKAKIIIYSPYEKNAISSDGLIIKPLPSLFAKMKLVEPTYWLSRELYYSKLLSKFLLKKSLFNFSKIFAEELSKALKRDKISVLQVEHDFSIPGCLDAVNKLNIPIIAELHNISAEELVSGGILKQKDQEYKILQKQLGELLNEMNLVCVVSKYMAEYVKMNYSIDNNKTIVVSPGGLVNVPSSHDYERSNKKVIYSGMVTSREHVDLFVKSTPFITEKIPDASYHITKKGEELAKITELARELDTNINWFWYSSDKDFYDFLNSMDVGILTSKDDEARRLGTPIKLFDYMSVGLPVVANDIGAWCDIIKKEELGILTDDNPEQFASAVVSLLEDEELRRKFSLNALKATSGKYNWDITIKPLLNAYKEFI
jgi:glycosyltransferase involved in cell wall biosynthesis